MIIVDRISTVPGTKDCSNIVNGVYLKEEEDEVWRTELSEDNFIEIEMDLGRQYKVAMVRVWNYLNGKDSSAMGSRLISMELDKQFVFIGEIQQSSQSKKISQKHETILFTEDEAILGAVSRNDWMYPLMEKEEKLESACLMEDISKATKTQMEVNTCMKDKSTGLTNAFSPRRSFL